jgi:hypothetical protein
MRPRPRYEAPHYCAAGKLSDRVTQEERQRRRQGKITFAVASIRRASSRVAAADFRMAGSGVVPIVAAAVPS